MNIRANPQLSTSPRQVQTTPENRLILSAQPGLAPEIDHWVGQLWEVPPHLIDDPRRLAPAVDNLVDALGLTRVSTHTHYFGPGVSSVVILSESHLSVHTWPELGYVHLDLVTCVKKLTHDVLEAAVREALAPGRWELLQLEY